MMPSSNGVVTLFKHHMIVSETVMTPNELMQTWREEVLQDFIESHDVGRHYKFLLAFFTHLKERSDIQCPVPDNRDGWFYLSVRFGITERCAAHSMKVGKGSGKCPWDDAVRNASWQLENYKNTALGSMCMQHAFLVEGSGSGIPDVDVAILKLAGLGPK